MLLLLGLNNLSFIYFGTFKIWFPSPFLPLPPSLSLSLSLPLPLSPSHSIICVALFAIFIAIKTSIHLHHDDSSIKFQAIRSDDENIVGFFPSSFKGAITCLSYCSLTFLCQFQLFSLEKELNRPRQWKLNFIIIASMILAYTLYNIVAFSGYLSVSP